MKILNLILALIFLLFAAVQLNDDPSDIWFWVILYSAVSAISAFAAFNKYNMWVIVIAIGIVVYQMFRWFLPFSQWISSGMPSITGEMKASSPHVELVREFFGLVVCLCVLVFHYVRYAKMRRAVKEDVLIG